MKCPICEAEIKNISESELRCIRCGFDDIRTEFINDEEIKKRIFAAQNCTKLAENEVIQSINEIKYNRI